MVGLPPPLDRVVDFFQTLILFYSYAEREERMEMERRVEKEFRHAWMVVAEVGLRKLLLQEWILCFLPPCSRVTPSVPLPPFVRFPE